VTSKRFLVYFIVGVLATAATVVPLNMRLDVYGLFRPAQGRRISIYGEERLAKFLHAFRYIPENFDGILVGSSVSDTLDTTQISGWRIYNASINGGNVTDIKPIVEIVLRKTEMRVTIVCIHRYLTKDHDRKTDLMNSRQYWGAFGSPQLISAYVSLLAMERGFTSANFNAAGVRKFGSRSDPAVTRRTIESVLPGIERGTASVDDYSIDPVALQELNELMATARSRSRRVIVFYPPTPEPVLAACQRQAQSYRSKVQTILRPSDIVIDFNGPGYEDLRRDYDNFVDPVHLSQTGARAVMAELNRTLGGADSGPTEASRQ